jgi:RimJ/RimL family protein N-acetyltransferase
MHTASAALPRSTARLTLRHFTTDDAAFIVQLLNDADFIRYIADRGVRTLDDARNYIRNTPLASYARHGFGLYAVQLKSSGEVIGMCGLIKRDTLPDVDIGYAFLPQYRGQGYALEAAQATLQHARDDIGLSRLIAIVDPMNEASVRLLKKLGMSFERTMRWHEDDSELAVYASMNLRQK